MFLPMSQDLNKVITLTALVARATLSCSAMGGALGPSSRSTWLSGLMGLSVCSTSAS